jgi:hypothetical protein
MFFFLKKEMFLPGTDNHQVINDVSVSLPAQSNGGLLT